MSNSVRPHRRQPTRHPRPWDSPGKNTGVGCHFLLQCMKVKSESEVAQLCPTLSDPMDCSLPGSSVHGIFQARVLERGAIAFSENKQQIFVILGSIPKKRYSSTICSSPLASFFQSLGSKPLSQSSRVLSLRCAQHFNHGTHHFTTELSITFWTWMTLLNHCSFIFLSP